MKAHDTMTIGIKCTLPKELRNRDFIAKPFRSSPATFLSILCYNCFANSTSKGLTIKAGTVLGCVSFELIRDLSQCSNTIKHLQQDMDGSRAMCSLSMSPCPINHPLGLDPDIVQNKSYVSLKAVNLKPFYIKPYLTHETEIKFAEEEMEKLSKMTVVELPVNFYHPSCSSKSHTLVQSSKKHQNII